MAKTERQPIMSEDEEKFMAYYGLIQWTQGVIFQSKRVISATEKLLSNAGSNRELYTENLYLMHCEHHYFVIATFKLFKYYKWSKQHNLFPNVDFSELDSVNYQDIKDLRNMREHVVEYFQGDGNAKMRWWIETSDFKADASSCVGTLIGGRLDYVAFTEIANKILPELLKEPYPYLPSPLTNLAS